MSNIELVEGKKKRGEGGRRRRNIYFSITSFCESGVDGLLMGPLLQLLRVSPKNSSGHALRGKREGKKWSFVRSFFVVCLSLASRMLLLLLLLLQ